MNLRPSAPRRGSVLILVLWIVIVLGLIGLTYTASVRTQLMTSRSQRGRHVAQWAARSGVERAIAELGQTELKSIVDGSELLNSEELFSHQPVDDYASYSLIGPPDDEGNPRFGLVDECSRVSINRASEAMLLNLTGVTTEMAESLIDWRDANEEPLTEGGESDYYESLATPYAAKNAAFDSMRELMRVKGWGPVFDQGWPDAYKRFAPLPEETDATAAAPTYTQTEDKTANSTTSNQPQDGGAEGDGGQSQETQQTQSSQSSQQQQQAATDPNAGISTGDEMLPEDARKLLGSLTAWSAAPVTNPDGGEKVNLKNANAGDLTSTIPSLTREEADAIVAYGRFNTPADLLLVPEPQNGQDSGNQGSSGRQGSRRMMFDLARVGEIIDYCTTRGGSAKTQTGLININTAPRDVLLAIPGMTEELADEIINERDGSGAFNQPGELATLSDITSAQFRRIYPWICTESCRFHVTSQGVDADSGAVATVEAVLEVDAQQQVTVVYWREF